MIEFALNVLFYCWLFCLLAIPVGFTIGAICVFVSFVFSVVLFTVATIIRAIMDTVLTILGYEYNHWEENDSPGGEFSTGVRCKMLAVAH